MNGYQTINNAGQWFVINGPSTAAGPFKSNSEAWRWIDRAEGDAISKAEARGDWLFEQQAKRVHLPEGDGA